MPGRRYGVVNPEDRFVPAKIILGADIPWLAAGHDEAGATSKRSRGCSPRMFTLEEVADL
jgi:hypothetical protein